MTDSFPQMEYDSKKDQLVVQLRPGKYTEIAKNVWLKLRYSEETGDLIGIVIIGLADFLEI